MQEEVWCKVWVFGYRFRSMKVCVKSFFYKCVSGDNRKLNYIEENTMFVLLLENDREFRNKIEKHFYNILKTGNFF